MTERIEGHKFSWANLGGSPIISEDQCSCGWRGPLNYAKTRETAVGSYYDKHIDALLAATPSPTGDDDRG